MRYVQAVSGGVDSMVLLHQVHHQGQHELIVAHFDHGIRPDSAADARFVEAAAQAYGLPFVSERVELGPGASEEMARRVRYDFLQRTAAVHEAAIMTAHHADDVIETIALNLQRGTGWRGLSVLDRASVVRPLLSRTKRQLYDYALQHRLEWVEDSTNAEDSYTRNRLRRQIGRQITFEQHEGVMVLWRRQREVKRAIERELMQFMSPTHEYTRYMFTMMDDTAAYEVLRAAIMRAGGASPLRPQAERALLAIKTAQAGRVCDVGGGTRLRFTQRTFIVEQ
jgi:tRNA(Ile)-lysidine synthetase-like protein